MPNAGGRQEILTTDSEGAAWGTTSPATPLGSLVFTVQLSLPPTLYLEGFAQKYVAAQLHLHWGRKGTLRGSEHHVDGEATAAEVRGVGRQEHGGQ